MLELKIIDFIFFLIIYLFIYLFIRNLKLGVSMILHVIVTLSHDHMAHRIL